MIDMSGVRIAKMKKAKDIRVGDTLVKFFKGRIMYADVVSVKAIIGRKGEERIRIDYGGFAIVGPDTELEVR